MDVNHPVSGTPKPGLEGEIALCLSGGGFRASLFHLGALRRLNELGILGKVDTLCSVSGGSIIAAQLARAVHKLNNWPIPVSEWDEAVSTPFHKFTGKDLRTSILLRKYLPWNLVRRGQRAQWLESKYETELTGGMMLSDMRDSPRFVFCATDLGFGDTWTFSREQVGSYPDARIYDGDLRTFPVARAVAASSCFPPIFGPIRLAMKASKPQYAERWQPFVLLNDGGVRDNMGLDRVWERYKYVIVSDGGAPFRFSGHGLLAPWLGRTLAVVQNQASAVRKKWLVSEFRKKDKRTDKEGKEYVLKGTYWGIASGLNAYPESKNEFAYSRALAESVLSRIRTDLNAFSEAERQILENHGYMLANAASKSFLKDLISGQDSIAVPPYACWFRDKCKGKKAGKESINQPQDGEEKDLEHLCDQDTEERICKELEYSHRRIRPPRLRKFFGQLFDQPIEGEA